MSFADDVEARNITVKIKKPNGAVIYTDYLTTSQVTKVYDMVEYGRGKFIVQIIGTDFKLVKEVEVGQRGGFDAKVIQKNERIELIYLSHVQHLDIYLKDADGNMLYQGEGKLGKYRQVFDVQQLPKGNYSLIVTNGDQIFEEQFKVK